jgi:HlyD family secretion protein
MAITGLVLSWFGGGNSQTIQYKTDEVERGDLIVTVTATGTLEPVNQVEVGSEISGIVKTVAVDFNDRIKQGQVLTMLDTDQLQARVKQADASLQVSKAQVKQAEATVIETKNTLRRSRELAKSGMCSEKDCDTAQAAYDRAEANLLSTKAQVAQSQASLDAEQISLSKATIHSPINGIVLERNVEPGQTVAASLQTPVLFTLAEDLTQMELHVDVDEADVGQVLVGQLALFTVDAYPDKSFPAEIIEVHFASQTVEGVVTYETVLRVDNSALLLRPGMTATADITVNKVENVLLVTNAALRFTPPTPAVETSTGGSLVSQLIPRPPRSGSKLEQEENGGNQQRQVWVLRDEQLSPVIVSVGVSDGVRTEVLTGDLTPDMKLVVETISQAQ